MELSRGVILLCGFAIPFHRLHLILLHAFAVCVADAQVVLSLGEILLGGFAIPLHRLHLILRPAEQPLRLILRHTFAVCVADTPAVWSLGVILFRGPTTPFHRLSLVLRHAFSLFVAKTELHLGLCVACFCLRLHFLNRFLIGLGLLAGQLNDSDTRRQQKREYQPTRFHIRASLFPLFMAEPVRNLLCLFSAHVDHAAFSQQRTLPITDPREASTMY